MKFWLILWGLLPGSFNLMLMIIHNHNKTTDNEILTDALSAMAPVKVTEVEIGRLLHGFCSI